jgi:hypothetical protein
MALSQVDAIYDARQAATLTVKIVRASGESAPRRLIGHARYFEYGVSCA